MDYREKRFEIISKKVIAALESRNMQGFYAADRAEALQIAASMIPDGTSVGWGGSISVDEIGLKEALKEKNCELLDRTVGDEQETLRKIFSADFFLSSTNAISEDGVLVNIDGMSNRIAAIAFGPASVIMIVGRNKLVKTVEDAYKRAQNIASPINACRIGSVLPCTATGSCVHCRNEKTICCNLMVTRYSRIPGRIKVILVNEELGY